MIVADTATAMAAATSAWGYFRGRIPTNEAAGLMPEAESSPYTAGLLAVIVVLLDSAGEAGVDPDALLADAGIRLARRPRRAS